MCTSTQWVVSLTTALSPSSCMVIQDKEYNHTLGSLTPLGLVPQSVSMSRSHISSGFLFGICIEKERCRMHHIRYVGRPVRQENHLSDVASQSPALSES